MSFILDALKKSEADRQRQAAPALFEVKVASPRRAVAPWAWGLAALVLLNAAVLAWVLLRARAENPAAVASSPPSAGSASATPTPASGEAPAGAVTVPATVTFQVNVPAPAAPAASAEPGVVAPSPAPPLAEAPRLSGEEPAISPDYDARDFQPALTPEQAAAVAAARRAGAVPSRDEVLARGTPLPDLRMDLHVFDADPGKRFVFINMRKLREGDSLPEGVRVLEITPTGVRLAYQGNEFALSGR